MLLSNIFNESIGLLQRQLKFYCWHFGRNLNQKHRQELIDLLYGQPFETLADKIKALNQNTVQDCKQQVGKLLFGHCLSRNFRSQLIQLIESNLVDLNVRLDNYGNTLLHRAAYNLDVELVQILIKHGVNIRLRDYAGNTALHIAIQSYRNGTVIYGSEADVEKNLTQIIQLILEADAKLLNERILKRKRNMVNLIQNNCNINNNNFINHYQSHQLSDQKTIIFGSQSQEDHNNDISDGGGNVVKSVRLDDGSSGNSRLTLSSTTRSTKDQVHQDSPSSEPTNQIDNPRYNQTKQNSSPLINTFNFDKRRLSNSSSNSSSSSTSSSSPASSPIIITTRTPTTITTKTLSPTEKSMVDDSVTHYSSNHRSETSYSAKIAPPQPSAKSNNQSINETVDSLSSVFLDDHSTPLVNTTNAYGRTALHFCVLVVGEKHLAHFVKLLISFGANCDAIDHRMKTPLYCLVKRPNIIENRRKLDAIYQLLEADCDDLGLAIKGSKEYFVLENTKKNDNDSYSQINNVNNNQIIPPPSNNNVDDNNNNNHNNQQQQILHSKSTDNSSIDPIFTNYTFKRVPPLKHLARLAIIRNVCNRIKVKPATQVRIYLPEGSPKSLDIYVNKKLLDQSEFIIH